MNSECSFPVYIIMIRKQKPNDVYSTSCKQPVMKYFLLTSRVNVAPVKSAGLRALKIGGLT